MKDEEERQKEESKTHPHPHNHNQYLRLSVPQLRDPWLNLLFLLLAIISVN